MATSKITSTPNAWMRTLLIDSTSVPDDTALCSFPAGVYKVTGTQSSYVPFRYGTLLIFRAYKATSYEYVLVIGKDTQTNDLYVRHGYASGWHTSWIKYAGTAL